MGMRRSNAGWRLCFLGLMLPSLLGTSCGDEDAGSDGPTADGGPCARGTARLRACGLLGAGTALCSAQTAERPEEASCTQACLEGAECATLSSILCAGEFPSDAADAADLNACVSRCSEQHGFQCGAGALGRTAVPSTFVCDGEADCGDGSDEAGCEQFDCGGGETVVAAWFCDGVPDCSNAIDEGAGCEHFSCSSGGPVPLSFRCDGVDDCGDGSDEAGCDVAALQCP